MPSKTPIFPTLYQPKRGYRYGLDSFLLVRFAKCNLRDVVCDLGAGVGILGLLALQRYGVQRVVAVELQKELADFAEKNAGHLGFQDKMEVLVQDWKTFPAPKQRAHFAQRFSVVFSNPPYRKLQTGRLPPLTSKAIAKHEIHGNMRSLLLCTKRVLKPSGRFYGIYPALRLEEFLQELARAGMKAQRMAFVHPYQDRPATHVMVEAVLSGVRELQVEAPVVVYRDADHYQPDIEAWVGKKRRV